MPSAVSPFLASRFIACAGPFFFFALDDQIVGAHSSSVSTALETILSKHALPLQPAVPTAALSEISLDMRAFVCASVSSWNSFEAIEAPFEYIAHVPVLWPPRSDCVLVETERRSEQCAPPQVSRKVRPLFGSLYWFWRRIGWPSLIGPASPEAAMTFQIPVPTPSRSLDVDVDTEYLVPDVHEPPPQLSRNDDPESYMFWRWIRSPCEIVAPLDVSVLRMRHLVVSARMPVCV
jgi:hypothetical protein